MSNEYDADVGDHIRECTVDVARIDLHRRYGRNKYALISADEDVGGYTAILRAYIQPHFRAVYAPTLSSFYVALERIIPRVTPVAQ